MTNSYRRQQIVTDPDLQRRVVITCVWPVVAAFVVMGASLGLMHWRIQAVAVDAGMDFDGLDTTFFAVYALFLSAAGFVLFHSLRLSHRIAGPLYRFRRTYESVRSGELDARVKLREGDFLNLAASDLNEFLDWVAATQQAAPSAGESEPQDAGSVVNVEAQPAAAD